MPSDVRLILSSRAMYPTLKSFCNLEVIHTPELTKRFSKARFIISSQYINDSINQLEEMGYDNFFSQLNIINIFETFRVLFYPFYHIF